MKKNLILILTIVVTLASCKKYEVQYGTEEATTKVLLGDEYEIAYSTDKGVFLVNSAMNRSKMLVSFANKPSPKAGRVALSANRDKVAYVDPDNGVPIIVDTSGNVLVRLTQYPNTKDLGWHNGEETLYLLVNNHVYFYGQALDLPSPLFVPPSNSHNYEITTLDINEDLDVVYGAIYYERPTGGLYRVWYDSYNLNYKAASLTDESNKTLNTTQYSTQNIAVDTIIYYHTIRFLDINLQKKATEISKAYGEKTLSNTKFKDSYTFGGASSLNGANDFHVEVWPDGTLRKSIYFSSESSDTGTNGSWEVGIPLNAPFYVDWPPFF